MSRAGGETAWDPAGPLKQRKAAWKEFDRARLQQPDLWPLQPSDHPELRVIMIKRAPWAVTRAVSEFGSIRSDAPLKVRLADSRSVRHYPSLDLLLDDWVID